MLDALEKGEMMWAMKAISSFPATSWSITPREVPRSMSLVTPPSGYCFKKVEMGVVSPTRPMWSTLPMCRCPLLENRLMEAIISS